MREQPDNRNSGAREVSDVNSSGVEHSLSGGGPKSLITKQRVLWSVWIITAAILGLILPFVDFKIQFVMIAMFPAASLTLIVMRNPYLGVCAFLFYEYVRPDNFIPALRPLHLALLLEIITLIAWLQSNLGQAD